MGLTTAFRAVETSFTSYASPFCVSPDNSFLDNRLGKELPPGYSALPYFGESELIQTQYISSHQVNCLKMTTKNLLTISFYVYTLILWQKHVAKMD
jgi:hypothetical protein